MNIYENILKLEEKYRTSPDKEYVLVFYFQKDNSKALKMLKKELPALKLAKINNTQTAFFSVSTNHYFISKFKDFIKKIQDDLILTNQILKPATFNTIKELYQEYQFDFDVYFPQQNLQEVAKLLQEEQYIPNQITSAEFLSQLKQILNTVIEYEFDKQHSHLHKNPTFTTVNNTQDISLAINQAVDAYFKLAEDKIFSNYAQFPILFKNPLINENMHMLPLFKGDFDTTIHYFLQFNIDVTNQFFFKIHQETEDINKTYEESISNIKNLHPIFKDSCDWKDLGYELSTINLHDPVANFTTFTQIVSTFIGECIKSYVSNENCQRFIQYATKHNTLIHFDPTDYLRFSPGHITMAPIMNLAKKSLNDRNSHEFNLILSSIFEESEDSNIHMLSAEDDDDIIHPVNINDESELDDEDNLNVIPSRNKELKNSEDDELPELKN